MKIATFDLDIQPGKYKYACECFDKLVEKFNPKKETPYSVEFIADDFQQADAVMFDIKKKFDFVFVDIERIEKRLLCSEDEQEKNLLKKSQEIVEKEELLCEHEFSQNEQKILANLALVSYKPSLGVDNLDNINQLIKNVLEKAGVILFFTVGKKEARVWDIKKGDNVVIAAGRIHSDLARGFIRADVVNCRHLDSFFNMAEARARGFVQNVDKSYIVQEGDIIEIKFSV